MQKEVGMKTNILLIDGSKESRKTEEYLKQKGVEFASVNCEDNEGRLPCLIVKDSAYPLYRYAQITGYFK